MASRDEVERSVVAIWRVEGARIVGALVRLVRDVGLAEDLAQEALVAALAAWPVDGVPDNPGAWLMTTARRRGLDLVRRRSRVERADERVDLGSIDDAQLAALAERACAADVEPDELPDDVLRLVFAACHPLLSREARVALTLRLVAGLSTDAIARAFLVPEPTVAQRIARAKASLREARADLDVPGGSALVPRLASVLEVVYLVFNEGHSAARGDDWMRPALVDEALRLGRILAARLPREAEVWGLLALMELSAARMPARLDAEGTPVLLDDQDRARWDRLLITRGLAALDRAAGLATPLGPYTLQAAIAACHARATRAADTDWPRIVALYDALVEATGSAVVELNRAVAVARAFGPQTALELVDELAADPALAGYHLVPAVRGHLLEALGRFVEARDAYELAAASTGNAAERTALRRHVAACEGAAHRAAREP